MDNEPLLKEIIRRLDILIALQIEILGGPDASSPTHKILRLSELGMSPSEIAAIIGKTNNYVTATLSRKKKQKKAKEGKK